ncbi:MAG TPA: AMP-binding protein, partial [Thermoanaerobaculia bacterium]|nr:AMP-binding protein [Thermoanaerobaculia bacterium]
TSSGQAAGEGDEEALLAVVRGLVAEVQPGRRARRVALDSSLERDLGLDSLGRAELLLRLGDAFGITLPEQILAEAESPRDLLRAVERAAPTAAAAKEPRRRAGAEPAVATPEEATTLLAVLDAYADAHPDRRHVLFLTGEGEEEELTYGALAARSRAVASALRARGLGRGQTVGLMLPSGLDYFASFFGILRAGGVPVPQYPPARPSQLEDHLRRQAGILANARARLLITVDAVKPLARLLQARAPELAGVVTPADLAGDQEAAEPPPVAGSDTVFLQYTSGSTGDPKGVILTHDNLLANLRSIGEVLELGGEDVVVSWLPLYHDMGLIGAWMGSLYFGVPLVLMSPLAFLARPVRWLEAIDRHRGTISAAPDFAYSLCVDKVSDDQLAGLDLSRWRLALNGAEPVSPTTVERFAERFAGAGFDGAAMMPVYGLAENSLAVTFPPPGRGPRIDRVRRQALQREDRADPAASDETAVIRFVSSGQPIPHHQVQVVDEHGAELPERRQGRVRFRGPSATSGYFRNPAATHRLVREDGWLDSEDLGYLADGELFLTGRAKDLIIRAGRNLYPQELEEAVGELPGVRKGGVAVFATAGAEEGGERMVVVAESESRTGEAAEELRGEVAGLCSDLVGSAPDEVLLVPPRSVPKTSSGKIRRSTARELYLQGRLGAGPRAVWWQLARLAVSAVPGRLARLRRGLGERLWSLWFWLVFLLVAPGGWAWVVLLPGRGLRRRAARMLARLVAGLSGIEVRGRGLEHLPRRGPVLVAANHQSYLDAFVLTAALPPRFGYVAKDELRGNPFTRLPLARLGALFVERSAPEKGGEETARALQRLRDGDSLVIFPEGTFQRQPGLMPLRMGAFVIAARAGAPVVPVAIRGTRSILRGGTRMPRRGGALVVASEPMAAAGDRWEDAVALRDAVRRRLLELTGEPDLGV